MLHGLLLVGASVLLVGAGVLLVGAGALPWGHVHFWWVLHRISVLLVGAWCTLGGCLVYFRWVLSVVLVGVRALL